MHWIRRHPKDAAAYAALAVGVLMLLVFAYINFADSSDGAEPGSLGSSSGGSLPRTFDPSEATQLPTGTTPADGATMFDRGLNGLLGQGHSVPAAKHSVTLRVTAASPIDFVAFNVPTAKRRGVDKNVGTSWSLSTTAFGNPDYAQIFLQANGNGDPITCTITVDGKLTERRTTQHPYGQIFCQG